MSAYEVKLPVFEGPFDLLFHLIEDQKIDIYDIPIAKVTEQYLEYIQMMEILDMEVASSFLVMAATLIEIKSKMLLPKERPIEPDPEMDFNDFGDDMLGGFNPDDPRASLVEKLLEYKKFKLVAQELRIMEASASRIYTRKTDIERQPEEILEIKIGSVELLDIYHALIRRRLMPPIHRVVLGKLSIIDRIKEIRDMLKKFKGEVTFARLLKKEPTRYDTVLSFMAVLEMIKAGEIGCKQEGNFASIYITPGRNDKEFTDDDYKDMEDIPDDVSRMPVAKAVKKADDDIKAIKIKDIPDDLLQFKTPSELAAEKAAAEAALLPEIVPETPDLNIENVDQLVEE